jgi:phospholipid transport system substrate-binding protein
VFSRPTPVRRRPLLTAVLAGLVIAGAGLPGRARATDASGFVKDFADQLVAVVNGPQDAAGKKQALARVIDQGVDVDTIARFCLGRFWSTASPQQQTQYTALFHRVLLNNIGGHLGDYQGVSFTLGGTETRGGDDFVETTITRPNAPTASVQWVVESASGSPKVVDVVAEGTSLRLTERNDYASYLGRHGGSIDALLSAMQRQLGGAG